MSAPDRTPREGIEEWLAERTVPEDIDYPALAGIVWVNEIVRAALEIIDADHHEAIVNPISSLRVCACDLGMAVRHRPWPCKVKAEHERKLWRSINGT